jgi:hypothetical protein
LFFLLLAEKMAGAMSFGDAPSSHAECQKKSLGTILAPSSPALKSCRLVSSQGMSIPTQGLLSDRQACHSQLRRSALANL